MNNCKSYSLTCALYSTCLISSFKLCFVNYAVHGVHGCKCLVALCFLTLTRAWSGAGVAHNGIAPRDVSCRLGWVCETWGRVGGHL